MTDGQMFLSALRLKAHFRDPHERRVYYRSVEIARRIVDDPGLLDRGRRFMERYMRDDPHQRAAYDLWSEMLRFPATDIARRLVADDETGGYLRETAPVFTIIERRAIESAA